MEHTETKKYNGHQIATAFYDTENKAMVIFCHGFRGTSVGPSRFFVRAARKLAAQGISSLRFDQYGSGNSEGDFRDSSFNDWLATTRAITHDYLKQGFQVALFGQSMGGSTVIAIASEITQVTAVVAWVPDPKIKPFNPPKSGVVEENGFIVQSAFWQEAYDAKIGDKLPLVKAPTYIVQCTNDEYIDQQNRDLLSSKAQPHQKIDIFEGYSHGAWSYQQSEDIINRSVDFLVRSFQKQTTGK
jgi:uncharacterized protein